MRLAHAGETIGRLHAGRRGIDDIGAQDQILIEIEFLVLIGIVEDEAVHGRTAGATRAAGHIDRHIGHGARLGPADMLGKIDPELGLIEHGIFIESNVAELVGFVDIEVKHGTETAFQLLLVVLAHGRRYRGAAEIERQAVFQHQVGMVDIGLGQQVHHRRRHGRIDIDLTLDGVLGREGFLVAEFLAPRRRVGVSADRQ